MTELRSPRAWLAAAWSVFQLYTAYAGMYDLLIQLPVHVAFAVALGFLTDPVADFRARLRERSVIDRLRSQLQGFSRSG